MTVENTLGDKVGWSIMSTEWWESNGFHLVLEELELGVLTLFPPELAERTLAVPELGVRVPP